jgi:predicted enzyme related to lactoylglutathione lyase
MSKVAVHHQINYIEFTTADIERTKQFYAAVFGWSFQDWGPEYIGLEGAGIEGGFAKGEPNHAHLKATPLVILYSENLEATEAAIIAAGGSIVIPTFTFPGGRRFHFADGLGNVLAVWSE